MNLLVVVSNLIVPSIILFIVVHGVLSKVNIFEAFAEGVIVGAKTVYNIFPTFVGLMVAVSILSSSGTLNIIADLLKPFVEKFGLPSEAIPLTFMRLVSSSASTGLLLDIFKNHGPDSYIGRFVSIMMSCTETIFYTMSVYFMSVKITKTRYTLTGALIANFVAVVASIIITQFMFS